MREANGVTFYFYSRALRGEGQWSPVRPLRSCPPRGTWPSFLSRTFQLLSKRELLGNMFSFPVPCKRLLLPFPPLRKRILKFESLRRKGLLVSVCIIHFSSRVRLLFSPHPPTNFRLFHALSLNFALTLSRGHYPIHDPCSAAFTSVHSDDICFPSALSVPVMSVHFKREKKKKKSPVFFRP